MTAIRRPGAASAAVLVGLTVSLLGAYTLAPEWSRRVGLDVWNYAAVDAARRHATEEWAEMNARAEREARRRALGDQLAARLITGDAPLATVAGELLVLFAETPGSRTSLEAANPQVRDPHLLYARHAIFRAERLISDPAQRAAVRARLESDYRAMEAKRSSAQ